LNSSGTDEYISKIVKQYSQKLFRTAFTILHSSADAEDVVQEVFIKLLDKRPVFNDSEHEKAWLLRVTINLSRNRLRSFHRKTVSLEEYYESAEPASNTDLLDAVISLPEKYSTVIHLYYYEGYSLAEIAKILNIPQATVGTRLSRGRNLLKTKLKED